MGHFTRLGVKKSQLISAFTFKKVLIVLIRIYLKKNPIQKAQGDANISPPPPMPNRVKKLPAAVLSLEILRLTMG
jgi:hypothetical protein